MDSTPSSTGAFSRRDALRLLGTLGAVAVAPRLSADERKSAPNKKEPALANGTIQPFVLPPLGYLYDALEPQIDARTMEIHHAKHHQAYIDNANKALTPLPALRTVTAEALLANLSAAPESARTTLLNNVGGHVNHSFFWKLLAPGGKKSPGGELASAINSAFGSLEGFKTAFSAAATTRFGSGWAWLVVKGGKLEVISTPNQDSPLGLKAVPILGLDVWEHAYYLKYQNKRSDYIQAFWQIVNWDVASANLRV